MTRLNTPTGRSFRTGEPTPKVKSDIAYARANDRANTRWYDELQVKYNVPYRDEEDYDLAGLLTLADHKRLTEIRAEEMALVT